MRTVHQNRPGADIILGSQYGLKIVHELAGEEVWVFISLAKRRTVTMGSMI